MLLFKILCQLVSYSTKSFQRGIAFFHFPIRQTVFFSESFVPETKSAFRLYSLGPFEGTKGGETKTRPETFPSFFKKLSNIQT